jgi:hypothetical protein
MKHTLLLLAVTLLLGIQSYAQNVGINGDGSEPDPAAALDVKSTDKGVLIPRVDFNNLPLSPPTGLLVYVTANGPEGNNVFYYYDGTQWQKLPASSGMVSSQWTNNGSDIYFNSGNVGIGTNNPGSPLQFSNSIINRKITLFTNTTNEHQFYGFGINDYVLRYQVIAANSSHVFYAATSATTSDELFRIKGTGEIVVPSLTTQGIIQNSASGVLSSTKGTASQVLKMNEAGTATEWGDGVLQGTAAGQMQYWNGTAWVTVAAGQNGQILKYKTGVPTWVDDNIENLSIGDYYQGGIIAYFLQPGNAGYDANVRHGLITAQTDQSINSEWGCNGTAIPGADGITLGTGAENTLDIVAGCSTAGIAAHICSDLMLNGYDDWFLPSKDELNMLYVNRVAIGGFGIFYYWSSSEHSNNYAWGQNLSSGYQGGTTKYISANVRAVRAF